jgi:hypothetical protein
MKAKATAKRVVTFFIIFIFSLLVDG